MRERKAGKHGTVLSGDRLAGLLAEALARNDDFIVTRERDEETGKERIQVIAGKFVSACMLRKLVGQAESMRDEGAVLLSGPWKKSS